MMKSMKHTKKPTPKIPVKEVLNEMKANGTQVQKFKGTNMAFKEKAWETYASWGESIEGDPTVRSGFFPSEAIIDTALCLADTLGSSIQREANSII